MIRLGPAGVGGELHKGLSFIAGLGLRAAEIEFTHGVRMSLETAGAGGRLAKKLGLSLSVHAPYFINLASPEPAKVASSKQRILASCERAQALGADYVVFHAGFYQGRSREHVYSLIREAILELMDRTRNTGAVLAPETTGKHSQFGDLDELLRLRNDTGCGLCVDFAHIYARQSGQISYPDIFSKLKCLKRIHSHYSGIEFTAKGERRHLALDPALFRPLAVEIVRRKADITIISESPLTWRDSLRMQEVFDGLDR